MPPPAWRWPVRHKKIRRSNKPLLNLQIAHCTVFRRAEKILQSKNIIRLSRTAQIIVLLVERSSCHTPMTHCLKCTGKWFSETLLRMNRCDVKYRTWFYRLMKMFTLISSLLDHQLRFQTVFMAGDIGLSDCEPSLLYNNRRTYETSWPVA
jgi:hypothetical protein